MVGIYELPGGKGRVTVTREGLYYRFSCRCKLTGDVMHRLVVSSLRAGFRADASRISAPDAAARRISRENDGPVRPVSEGDFRLFRGIGRVCLDSCRFGRRGSGRRSAYARVAQDREGCQILFFDNQFHRVENGRKRGDGPRCSPNRLKKRK